MRKDRNRRDFKDNLNRPSKAQTQPQSDNLVIEDDNMLPSFANKIK